MRTIFYFDKLKSWDRVTIILYLLLSIALWYYFDNTTNSRSQRSLIFYYALGTQFCLYFFNYKSLRNLTVYIFWTLIGILHLLIYFQLKDNLLLENERGHAAAALRNTLVLLLLFQVLRFISVKTQQKELVCPSRVNKTDLFDERQVTFIDFVLFVIYLGTAIILVLN